MPEIRFACPACGAVMVAPLRKGGQKVNCLGCGQRLQIPRAGTILAEELPATRVQPTPPKLPAKDPQPRPTVRYLLVGGAATIALCLVGCCGIAAVFGLLYRAEEEANKPLPVVEADLGEVLAAWEKNSIATRDRYRGKAVRLSGHLVEVDSNLSHQMYFHLAEKPSLKGNDRKLHVFAIEERNVKQLGKFSKGDHITADVVFNQGAGGYPRARLQSIPNQ